MHLLEWQYVRVAYAQNEEQELFGKRQQQRSPPLFCEISAKGNDAVATYRTRTSIRYPGMSQFDVYVRSLTGMSVPVSVSPSFSVKELKRQVANALNLNMKNFTLVYKGKHLDPPRDLEHYNIGQETTLYVIVKTAGAEKKREEPESAQAKPETRYKYTPAPSRPIFRAKQGKVLWRVA